MLAGRAWCNPTSRQNTPFRGCELFGLCLTIQSDIGRVCPQSGGGHLVSGGRPEWSGSVRHALDKTMILKRLVSRAETFIKGMLFDCRACGQCVLRQTG